MQEVVDNMASPYKPHSLKTSIFDFVPLVKSKYAIFGVNRWDDKTSLLIKRRATDSINKQV